MQLAPFPQPGQPLPRRNPIAIAAQHRAFSTRSIVITDLLRGPLTQDLIANIEVPIFKDGLPFRGLAIIVRHTQFLSLLSAQDIPRNWLVGIIDGQGCFIARVPKGATEVGQLASQGWRAIKDRTGVFEYPSLEGNTLISANAHPSNSNWCRCQESGAPRTGLEHSALGDHAGRCPFRRELLARRQHRPTNHPPDQAAAPSVCRHVRETWQAD
jgi:hypothetical protein